MNYIGIDLHKKFSQFTVLNEEGEVLDREKVDNQEETIISYLNNFDQPGKAVIEATFAWGWLADLLNDNRIEVMLAHPQKVKAIASAQIKTDKIDSEILAKLLKSDLIPEAYYSPKEEREVKEVLRCRASLVGLKTQIKNRIHSLLHKTNNREAEQYSDLFGKKGRLFLKSLDLGEKFNFVLNQYLAILEFLEDQVKEADKKLKDIFKEDKQAKLLEQLPGLGYYSALILSKEIGRVKRFRTAKHLTSYAGLVPSTFQSGTKTRHGRIKQGNKYIRWVLIQAVPKAIKKDKILAAFYQKINSKKGHNKAKVATARKMLAQIWHILTYQEIFTDPGTGSPVFFSGVHHR
jgi:transposase